jgi:hypothetical protein
MFLAVLTVGVSAWAQSPMTPSRLNPPTAGSTSWVEPPASAKPPATAAVGATAAAIPTAKPDQQAASTTEQRPARRSTRTARPSSDSMAARLNRQELNSIRSGGSGYYRGYWSWSGY